MIAFSLIACLTFTSSRADAVTAWPAPDWQCATEPAPVKAVAALDAFLFPSGRKADATLPVTDGVVLIHRGQLLYETYAHGYHATTPHLVWSAAKSFLNALVGIAVRDGKVALSDSVCRHLPRWEKRPLCHVTTNDLLQFSSGLRWMEDYGDGDPEESSVLAMLYGEGHKDMASFVAAEPLLEAPGTKWEYSSGDSNLLSAMLKGALGANYASYPWKQLFYVIGMKNVTWERDAAGTFVGSSYVYASPRELAKFGYLYLNDGFWNGKRVLPSGWVSYTSSLAPAMRNAKTKVNGSWVTGASWWLNVAMPERKIAAMLPDVPNDAYFAEGHFGQYIIVVPSWNLVAVRTGEDRGKAFDANQFLKLVAAVLPAGEK